MLRLFDDAAPLAGSTRHALRFGQAEGPALRCACLKKAYIWGAFPFISLHPGRLMDTALDESSNYPDTEHRLQHHLAREHVFRPQAVFEDCAFLANNWCHTFFHWMTECLPRVAYFEQAGFRGAYLVRAAAPFMRDSLAMLGVSADRIVAYTPDCIVKNLYVAEKFTFADLTEHAPVFFRIREALRAPTAAPGPRRRVYSHRSGTRRVLNAEAVQALCRQYAFEIVDLAALPLARQLEITANTSILAGPHGAGMVHAWFLPAGATLIEFFSRKYVNYTARPFIKLLRLTYFPLPEYSNQDYGDPNFFHNFCTADMTVAEDVLAEILRAAVALEER